MSSVVVPSTKSILQGYNRMPVYVCNDLSLSFIREEAANVSRFAKDNTWFWICIDGSYIAVNENGGETMTTRNMLEATLFCEEPTIINGINIDSHLRQLQVQGFTVLERYIPERAIDEMMRGLDLPEQSPKQVRHGHLLKRGRLFREALTEVVINTIVDIYVGSTTKCATWSSNTLFKTTPAPLAWHVDFPYHNIPAPWMHEARPISAQVLWAMDDFTPENGGTMIVPGSHVFNTFPTPSNMIGKTTIPLVCPKGSVVISHGAWWHAQGINTTDKPRTALLGTYVCRWLASKDDMQGQFAKLRAEEQTEVLKNILH